MLPTEILPDTMPTVPDVTMNVAGALSVATPAPAEQVDWSLWSLCADGYYFMLPIAVLFLIGLYVFIERCVIVSRGAVLADSFMERIKDYVHDSEIESAENYCRRTDTPCSRVAWNGISMLGRPMGEIADTMRISITQELCYMKKTMRWLQLGAAGAPLLGVVGAVAGLLAGAGDRTSAAALITPLATLLTGAAVGFVCLAGYQYLKARLNVVRYTLTTVMARFLDMLNSPAT